MSIQARDLAATIKHAARPGVPEQPFRQAVEAHLLQLAQDRGIDLTSRTEVTLGSSGRADTIYNRFIIEWEKPGSLKPSNAATKNRETIAQVQRYGDNLFWATREKPGRIVGCCTDGHWFIFVTKPDRRWEATDPVPVNEVSCRCFLDYFFSLQSGVALLPDYLAEDFSADNARTQRAVRTLYQTLESHGNAPALKAVFDQWAAFFGAVTEYEQWRVKLANETKPRSTEAESVVGNVGAGLHQFEAEIAVADKTLAQCWGTRMPNAATGARTSRNWPRRSCNGNHWPMQ